jgi:2'-5' RNA ligase
LCGPFSHFDSPELKKLSNISKRFDPFKIYLEEVQTKEKFYQSLFIKIIEKEDLLGLKNHIDSEFMMPKKNFFPHISLFYGKETEEKKAEAISKTINMNNSFVLDKISLVDVDEEINSWKIFKTYALFNLPRPPR